MSTWYGASLIFEATHDLETVATSLWEDRVVLVQAESEEEALELAEQMGRSGEHEYRVESPVPHLLRWKFRGIESLHEILSDTLASGVEVFSRLLDSEKAQLLGVCKKGRSEI